MSAEGERAGRMDDEAEGAREVVVRAKEEKEAEEDPAAIYTHKSREEARGAATLLVDRMLEDPWSHIEEEASRRNQGVVPGEHRGCMVGGDAVLGVEVKKTGKKMKFIFQIQVLLNRNWQPRSLRRSTRRRLRN